MSSWPNLGTVGQSYILSEEYKALFGYPGSVYTGSFSQENPGTSRINVFQNQLYSQVVPPIAPGATLPYNTSGATAIFPQYPYNDSGQVCLPGATATGITGTTASNNSSYPYIIKYTNVPLSCIQTQDSAGNSIGVTWVFKGSITDYSTTSTLQVTNNILNNGIPPNYDPANSYAAFITVIGSTYTYTNMGIGNTNMPWTWNTNSGIVMFTGPTTTTISGDSNVAPKPTDAVTMTFWRYEGTIGAAQSSQWTGTTTGETGIYYTGGNVGIGTTGPVNTLDVNSTSCAAISGTTGSIVPLNPAVCISCPTDAAGYGDRFPLLELYKQGTYMYAYDHQVCFAMGSGGTANASSTALDTCLTYFGNDNTNHLITGLSLVSVSKTACNLGINTSNPVYTLDVHGDTITLPSNVTLGVTDPYYSTIKLATGGGSGLISQGAVGATSSALTIRNTTAGGYLYLGTTGGSMQIDNSGNVSAPANITATTGTIGTANVSGATNVFVFTVAGPSSQQTYSSNLQFGCNFVGGFAGGIVPGDNIMLWTDSVGNSVTGNSNVSSGLLLGGKDNNNWLRIGSTATTTPTPPVGSTGTIVPTCEWVNNRIGGITTTNYWTQTGSYIYNNVGSYVGIGMGSTQPSYTLDVNGSIGTYGSVIIRTYNSSYPTQPSLYFLPAGDNTVGGGGWYMSDTTYIRSVNDKTIYSGGNIQAAGTVTAGSDYRIKEDIKPLQLEDYSVDNLKPVTFKFKKDGKKSIGVIAHELHEYFPFLVEGEKDGKETQTVNYNGLIGVLIKEIQELKVRVKELEKRI